MSDIVKIGAPGDVPKPMPYRSGRQKYPWKTMKPGEWFEFSSGVKPGSARVMASQASASWSMKFYVFLNERGLLTCRRVDGLEADQRYQRLERDEYGNVILPVAVLHPASEPVKRVGEGRYYGDGIPVVPMVGEAPFYLGDEAPNPFRPIKSQSGKLVAGYRTYDPSLGEKPWDGGATVAEHPRGDLKDEDDHLVEERLTEEKEDDATI